MFLYGSSVHSHHLLIFSASVRSLLFLSFIMAHPCMKHSLDISSFLEEISSLSHLLFSSIFLHCSFKKTCLSLLVILWNSAFRYIFPFLPCLLLLFFSQLFVKPHQTTTVPPYISFCLGWFWSLLPTQFYKPPSIVLQALSTKFNPLNLFITSTI